MLITWYGHSCFKLESDSGSVVLDPYSNGSVPGLTLPRDILADTVIYSHSHADHNAEGLVGVTGTESADVRCETLYTWHDEVQGKKRGMNTVNVIMIDGLRVAHLGDIGCELTAGQISCLGRLDALMIPVGGYYTIDAAQAKALADRIGAGVTIPMHYRGEGFGLAEIGTVEDFTRLCGDVERLDGSVFELKKHGGKKTVVFSRPMQDAVSGN